MARRYRETTIRRPMVRQTQGEGPSEEWRLRWYGFVGGLLAGVFALVAVLLFSDPRKRGERLLGAGVGFFCWLLLLYWLGAFDPVLVRWGLNVHDCYWNVIDGTTCTGLLSPR